MRGVAPAVETASGAHDRSPQPDGLSLRTSSDPSERFLQSAWLGRFNKKSLEMGVRCQLWISILQIEGLIMALIFLLTVALLVGNVIQSAANPELITPIAIVDGVQLVLILLTLWCGIRNAGVKDVATHQCHCPHSKCCTLPRVGTVRQLDPRDIIVPRYFASGRHDVQIGVIVFIAALRLSLSDLVFCSADGGVGVAAYQQCDTYGSGGYPFSAMAACIMVMGVYAALLATHDVFIMVLVPICYLLAAANSLALQSALSTAEAATSAPNTILVAILMVVACAATIGMGLYRICSWREERKLYMTARQHRDGLATQALQTAQARAKWETRASQAREEGYERAISYAAHELQNPLHVLLGLLHHNKQATRLLLPQHADVTAAKPELSMALQDLLKDLGDMFYRAKAMQRIVNNVIEFFKDRSAATQLTMMMWTPESILMHAVKAAKMFESLPQPMEWHVHSNAPKNFIADGDRIHHILIDCVADAVRRGAKRISCHCWKLTLDTVLHSVHGLANWVGEIPAVAPFQNEATATSTTADSSCTGTAAATSTGKTELRGGRPAVHWLVFAVRADDVVLEDTEAGSSDGTTHFAHMPLEQHSFTESPAATSSSIRSSVLASSLSRTVAQLSCRRLGGDLMIFSPRHRHLVYVIVIPSYAVASSGAVLPSDPLQFACSPLGPQLFGRQGGLSAFLQGQLRQHVLEHTHVPSTPLGNLMGVASRPQFRPTFNTSAAHNSVRPTPQAGLLPSASAATLSLPGAVATDDTEFVARHHTLTVATRAHPGSTAGSSESELFAAAARGSLSGMPDPLHLRVLYADDERSNRQLMTRYLYKLGCRFRMVDDGIYVPSQLAAAGMLSATECPHLQYETPELLECSSPIAASNSRQPFDVILLDIVMLQTDGSDVCRTLRSLGGKWERLPIIAVTGNAFDEGRLHAAGFNAVLAKPFTREALRVMLQRFALETTSLQKEAAGVSMEYGVHTQPEAATVLPHSIPLSPGHNYDCGGGVGPPLQTKEPNQTWPMSTVNPRAASTPNAAAITQREVLLGFERGAPVQAHLEQGGGAGGPDISGSGQALPVLTGTTPTAEQVGFDRHSGMEP